MHISKSVIIMTSVINNKGSIYGMPYIKQQSSHRENNHETIKLTFKIIRWYMFHPQNILRHFLIGCVWIIRLNYTELNSFVNNQRPTTTQLKCPMQKVELRENRPLRRVILILVSWHIFWSDIHLTTQIQIQNGWLRSCHGWWRTLGNSFARR